MLSHPIVTRIAGRSRRGVLQIGEHDSNPEKLGPELIGRTYLYFTLAALWPLAALILALHTIRH